LIFEGQFLNGERWEGYGKEFNDDITDENIKFEGEYKKGEKMEREKNISTIMNLKQIL